MKGSFHGFACVDAGGLSHGDEWCWELWHTALGDPDQCVTVTEHRCSESCSQGWFRSSGAEHLLALYAGDPGYSPWHGTRTKTKPDPSLPKPRILYPNAFIRLEYLNVMSVFSLVNECISVEASVV